jgi:hypothetical protein
LLGFFPKPYPDELFYSIVARFRVRAAILSPKMVIEDVFNSRTATAIIDLPCNIKRLCSNLPFGSIFTPEYFIEKHTLFPLYKPFTFQEQAQKVYREMLGPYGGSIHATFGTIASTVKYPAYLRFCPRCLEEEQNKYGEGYWHRLHQVPGVEVCPIHQVLLNDSTLVVKQYNKHEFLPASSSVCLLKPTEVKCSTVMFKELIGIATDIEWILNNEVGIKSLVWLQKQYIQSLITKDLATVMGRVRQKDMITAFRSYFGDELLKKLQSSVNDANEVWISGLVRKPRRIFHPLRHVLMIRFLAGSVPSLFAINHRVKPFGDGPWPCLNTVAIHYRQAVVTDVKVTYCYETKLPVGTFSCSCGFVYSRRGPDSSPDDRYRIGRIKKFGPIWEEKLKMLVAQGLSFRNVARVLRVDPQTVKKYSLVENFSTEYNTKSKLVLNDNITRKDEWIKLCQQNPQESVTKLRKLKPALYTWLYRHERVWLSDRSLHIQIKKNSGISRVNWEERDTLLCNKVRQEVNTILAGDGKPERITVSRIGKRLGILSLLEKKLDKLPHTKKCLSSMIESVEDYQKRRIIWAVKMLNSENTPLIKWRIKKIAGIGKCSKEINGFFDRVIGSTINNKVSYITLF